MKEKKASQTKGSFVALNLLRFSPAMTENLSWRRNIANSWDKKNLIVNLRPGSDDCHSENISVEASDPIVSSKGICSAEKDGDHSDELKLSLEEKVVLHVVKVSQKVDTDDYVSDQSCKFWKILAELS